MAVSHVLSSPSRSASLAMASFTRILTVPSGLAVLAAISLWLRPSKYASSMVAPLSGRQRAQRGGDAAFVAPPLRLHRGRGRRRRQQPVRVFAGACDRSSGDGPRAQAVDGAAAGDGDDPGDGAASSGIELGRPPPHFQEGLLNDVLRLFPVAQYPERDRDRPRRVLVVERPQRGDVAPGDACEKLPVARPVARTGGHGGDELGQAPFNIGCAMVSGSGAPIANEAMFCLSYG